MKFLMIMIPRVYQPSTPPEERAGKGFVPPDEAIARMGAYNEKLAVAGVLLDLNGLEPIFEGARLSFDGKTPTVTDGPYIETKEVIGGFWIIKVKSKEEALEWARQVPADPGDVIELRAIFEFPEESENN